VTRLGVADVARFPLRAWAFGRLGIQTLEHSEFWVVLRSHLFFT